MRQLRQRRQERPLNVTAEDIDMGLDAEAIASQRARNERLASHFNSAGPAKVSKVSITSGAAPAEPAALKYLLAVREI